MTDTVALPPTSEWDLEFQRLRERFPHAKDTILVCAHILQQSPEISLEDIKAQASLHGFRVTLGSVEGARRLLAPAPAEPLPVNSPPAERRVNSPAPSTPAPAPVIDQRPIAAPASAFEMMLRQTIADARAEGGQRAERMQSAIREALAVIREALDD